MTSGNGVVVQRQQNRAQRVADGHRRRAFTAVDAQFIARSVLKVHQMSNLVRGAVLAVTNTDFVHMAQFSNDQHPVVFNRDPRTFNAVQNPMTELQ